jgi:BirA family biotin operon repressor/biotin-[acetyl-CoA-carboxylase] ligase
MPPLPPIIRLDTVGSTNQYAEMLLSAGEITESTVIWALEQTAGKGLGENTWESEPGKNLTFSVVLFPHFLHPSRQFQLNKAVSLGVLDCVKSILPGQPCRLKWPNDIYAGSRKLGGILIRHIVSGEEISSTIAGIGLNINQEQFGSDLPNPVSVKQLLGRELDLEYSLHQLLAGLGKRYDDLRSGDEIALDRDYNENLLGFGHWSRFSSAGKELEGMISGVDDSGRLLLQTRDEKIIASSHGELDLLV